jgi:succinyl-CoA synthetase beta subunit
VRCDSIAQGLINTVANQAINIPIVARLQGTNMREAQNLVSFKRDEADLRSLTRDCVSSLSPTLMKRRKKRANSRRWFNLPAAVT